MKCFKKKEKRDTNDTLYRYGTHYKIGYGRCYCIEKMNVIGNWVTVYETDNIDEWRNICKEYVSQFTHK